MAYIDYDGTGEKEILATAYTTVLYEQEFKRDIIKDVFGRIDLQRASANFDADGNTIAIDYTLDDWNAELRALWALLKTAYEVARKNGEDRPPVGSFASWVMEVGAGDFEAISEAVFEECQRGFFRSGAAASKGKPAEGQGE